MTFEKESPRLFFYESLVAALGRLHLKVEQWTEFYLVELLARHIDHPATQEPLVMQLESALDEESNHERFLRFREMGDSALFLVGFCPENVDQRGVTSQYVTQMGGRAYGSAASLASDGMGHVYGTLSNGFNDFVRVLDEVKENTSFRTPQDIVKLYEKWQKTKSDTIARRLNESGLFIPSTKERGVT